MEKSASQDDAAAFATMARRRHDDEEEENEFHDTRNDATTKRQRIGDKSSARIAGKKAQGSDVLTLDIGGEKTVKTLRSTLTYALGSKLAETFSGRWDDSLPHNKEGDFFIDYKPELFIPLLDFLRTLSVATLPENNRVPPLTPHFDNSSAEESFHRMVDSYGLTNVLYNYELYKTGNRAYSWNDRVNLSESSSIFDCQIKYTDCKGCFVIDRPNLKNVARHVRQVQSFSVALDKTFDGVIGWMRRGENTERDPKRFDAYAYRIYVTMVKRRTTLTYYNNDGDYRGFELGKRSTIKCGSNSILRCCKNYSTGDLEWYLDDVLVATTSKILEYGEGGNLGDENLFRVGWTAPDDYEMIPLIEVLSGTCHISALELET